MAEATRGKPVDAAELKAAILDHLTYDVGKAPSEATRRDWFFAVAGAVRDQVVDGWHETKARYGSDDRKRVYYLSLEFLIGRLLSNAMLNLGVMDQVRMALEVLGQDLESILREEPDAALGNGGLGRLAACFLDSMATLGLSGWGYGIRYEYGMFRQSFDRGNQVEMPEDWLEFGNPWEFAQPEVQYPVDFFGHVEEFHDDSGRRRFAWRNTQRVMAMAYDTPIVGYGATSINTLRLWSARSLKTFDLEEFNKGDFISAISERAYTQNLSWVLYPADSHLRGQELRLKQEYFFTSAALQDIIRRYRHTHHGFDALPDKVAIQLNDTHPAIAVPEMMRLLTDVYGLDRGYAWDLTRSCINYTNHTLLPEALESWPVPMLEHVLPRHMQIIYEINAEFLTGVRNGHDGSDSLDDRIRAVSLIDEHGDRRVRMGNLAFLGSSKVNGVSALHTDLMKETVFRQMHATFPDKIVNVTNGVTPRRWVQQCNPEMSALITDAIGDGWVRDLDALSALEPFADNAGFRAQYAAAKRANKVRLAARVQRDLGIDIAPEALFDIQIKRIHEYKRQLLNILETIALYNEIRDHPTHQPVPRIKLFGGKAAASYAMAKLIIKLGNDVARKVNSDPAVNNHLRVVFVPNYNVSYAEALIPAADLSEQISTAGFEASGTGNMKFALNGALTIGTLDGANIEMCDRVGEENFYIFGLTAGEIADLRRSGRFNPAAVIDDDPRLHRVVEMLERGVFSPDDHDRFKPIVDALRNHDPFFVTADFAAYWATQRRVDADFQHPDVWLKKAVLNTARMGWFSSDRTVGEYADTIWRVRREDQRAAAE